MDNNNNNSNNNNNATNPWYFNKWFIFGVLLTFWPAGLVLLVLKNKDSRDCLFLGGTDKTQYWLVGGLIIASGLWCLVNKNYGYGVFSILGGAVIIFFSNYLVKQSERNRQYIDLIVNRHISGISTIAEEVGLPYERTLNELKVLQAIGVLKGAVINEKERTITIENGKGSYWDSFNDLFGGQASATASSRVNAVCPGCGARTVARMGAKVSCEYCNTQFTAEAKK